MNGKIGFKSQLEEGSCFWFTLPLIVKEDLLKPCSLAQHIAPTSLPIKRFDARILLIEDNVLNQKITSSLLVDLGCEVDIACNGAQAIKLVVQQPKTFDLILLDIGLPDIDGFEIASMLREIGFSQPIIVLTANCLLEKIEYGRKMVNDLLLKPVGIFDLQATLKKWLSAVVAD